MPKPKRAKKFKKQSAQPALAVNGNILLTTVRKIASDVEALGKAVAMTDQDKMSDAELEELFTGLHAVAEQLEDIAGTLDWVPDEEAATPAQQEETPS